MYLGLGNGDHSRHHAAVIFVDEISRRLAHHDHHGPLSTPFADEALKKLVEKDKKRLSPHTWNLARKLMMHGENADLSTVDLGFVSDGFGGQLGYGSGGSSYQHFGGRKMSLLTALYTLHERFVQRDKDGLRPDGWWLKKNRDKSKALAAKRSRTSGAGAGNVSYYHPVGPDDEDAHPLDNVRLRYDMEHFVESPVSSTTALLGHISNLRRHCGSWNFGTFLAVSAQWRRVPGGGGGGGMTLYRSCACAPPRADLYPPAFPTPSFVICSAASRPSSNTAAILVLPGGRVT